MLTRRTLLGSGLAAAALAPQKRARAEACILAPEQALGPYYLAEELIRRDIREGKAGVPLNLRLLLLDARNCRPLSDAAVDVWHCDAAGAYSGFGAGGDSHSFLRGIQLTDRDGLAQFHTVFPGCYPGRTNHIHFQVRSAGAVAGETYRGGHLAHTGQVFFPEDTTLRLMEERDYTAGAASRMPQDQDGIFLHQGGAASTARLTPVDAADPSRGFEALLVAAVDTSA
ncbi:intradiol ring-cleavage dioxygenase [Dongia sp.]|uniref:intradiol ring-cleavage dioxygenase n=1 Tax=Dongia sp. TaxID=1977262 RepID=UPI003750BCF2